jgi:predicted transcriptional regulator
MTQKEIQLKNLTSMLQGLDPNLLQRATDYIRGLIDASSEQKHDWWDDLPDSVKQDIDEGLQDIEDGNLIPMDEVMKKYSAE